MLKKIMTIIILGTLIMLSFVNITISKSVDIQTSNSSFNIPSLYDNRYAMIVVGEYINGDDGYKDYKYFLDLAQKMHDTLIDRYGFKQKDIFVFLDLWSEKKDPPNFDRNIWDFGSNEQSLINVFDWFKNGGIKEMNDTDLLFITWIDHGNKEDGKYYLCLNSEEHVYSYELNNYVNGIDGELIFALDACHSGGFINELSGKKRIICTSVDRDEIGFFRFDEEEGLRDWMDYFIWGLNGAADRAVISGNNDGWVTIEEVYHFAAYCQLEISGVHSLIDDNGDHIGTNYDSNPLAYDPENPTADGYMAKRTFLLGRWDFTPPKVTILPKKGTLCIEGREIIPIKSDKIDNILLRQTNFEIKADDKESGIYSVEVFYNGISINVNYDPINKVWRSPICSGVGVYEISVKNLLNLEFSETRKIICIGGNSPNFWLSDIFGLAI